MTDVFTPEKRSWIMGQVRGRNTKPELLVRSMIHRMGFRFRLHVSKLPGKPDIVLPRHKTVILVHGCFWHGHKGCPRSKRPETNKDFWEKKLSNNIERDRRNLEKLAALGWRTLVIWECETRETEKLMTKLMKFFELEG